MAKGKRGPVVYKSYSFVDKDPVIDSLRTLVSEARMSYDEINAAGGPPANTLKGWFHRNVRRPQNCTVMATARACGARSITFYGSKMRFHR